MATTDATTEWQEPNSVSLPTIVSSSDLFDGDLFGDELIDIYNAAVGEGADVVASEEIPTLLPQITEADDNKKPDEIQSEQIAAAIAVDDGLGAFRPSTSFNDLTTLLPPAAPANEAQPIAAAVDDAAPAPVVSESINTNGKRTAETEVAVQPVKKQCYELQTQPVVHATTSVHPPVPVPVPVPAAPTSVAPVAPNVVAGGQLPVAPAPAATETPNPLTSAASPVAAIMQPLPPPVVAVPSAVQSPAVVSPHPATQVKREVILPDSSSVISAAASVPVPALSAPPAAQTTEADFKAVAQAAVSSLISNVGAGSKTDSKSDPNGTPDGVDTSTAHIKALTGNNWVAACSGSSGSVAAASVAESKANNRARRQNLTPDERAKQNRDRNREHARNTRLRKKAYVEELKRTLTELVAQRDAADVEKRRTAQRELDQREVRFRVIEEFLKLRGRNEVDPTRWAAILEEGFTLTLPVTNYRKMVHIQNNQGVILEQVLTGVSEVMSDSSNCALCLQSYGGSQINTGMPVSLLYHCDRKNFFMDGSNAVLDWSASSAGAVKQGARVEISLRGTLKAKFSPASNKLLSANITFDTGLVTSQLNRLGCKPVTPTDTCDGIAAVAAAAQVASSQADAILDSLQMPQIEAAVPAAVNVVPSSAASVTSSDKGDSSSDESSSDDP